MSSNPLSAPWHVLGAGAIGGLWAMRLAHAGIPVTLIAHADDAPSRTLTLRDGGNTISHAFAQLPADRPGHIMRLLVTTKSCVTADALAPLLPSLSAGTPVLLLQNGMGVESWLQELRPDLCVITGITTDGVNRPERDLLIMAGHGETLIGTDDADCTDNAHDMATTLARAAPAVHFVSNIRQRRWQKLAINCAINPLTARYRCHNGELLTNPEALATMRAVCAEVALVMHAEGLPDDAGTLFRLACAAATSTSANISSMRADVDAGRQTEVRFLNGHVVACATRHGINVPANAALLQEILALPGH